MLHSVASLEQNGPNLVLETGHGLQCGDIFISSPSGDLWGTQAQLIATGIGTGNYTYTCPLYKAARDVLNMFVKTEKDMLSIKQSAEDLFEINQDSIITYATPEWYSSPFKRLDLLKSNQGFLGLRIYESYTQDKPEYMRAVWLCGPDNTEYAEKFGKRAYNKRRKLFASVYEAAAATDPIQMSNPIFPSKNGLQLITRGNKNVVN